MPAAPALASPQVPPIMTRPHLLAPGESWTYRCPHIIEGRDRGGVVRTLPCAITTQGGRAGLRAHQQVVHGVTPWSYTSGCVFCDPAKIATPWRVVMGRATDVACRIFEPLNPVVPGHTLIVPVIHVESATADFEVAAGAMEVAAWVAHRYASANIITSIGAPATQTVKHLHLHVVPRVDGDGLRLPWSP